MPPRWVTVLILVGWAATTFQLVFWEFLPAYSHSVPAPVFIALADETVGSRTSVRWSIKRDGIEVMRATSGLDYAEIPSEKFTFWMEYSPLPAASGFLHFRTLRTEYSTGRNGFLLGIASKMDVEGPAGFQIVSQTKMEGKVEGRFLKRKVEQKLVNTTRSEELSPVEIGRPPMVWFPFMPVWRIGRISPGDSWRVHCIDPLGDMASSGQGRVSGKILQIEVLKNVDPWKDDPKAILCRRIRATGEECKMELWVDPDSGKVMKQEVVLEFRHRWTIEREE